jgi:O-antigen/teichoic acid export membrane protein
VFFNTIKRYNIIFLCSGQLKGYILVINQLIQLNSYMSVSIKSNYIFNLINTLTLTLSPLITFPYATRIMQADGIGIVNFYNSIIIYITIIVGLGIPLYAVRQIARVRNSKKELDQTTVEIFFLHSILTILGYLVVFILCLTVPKIYSNTYLFLLLSLSIAFTTIGCEWYYQGMEDYRYITIRAIIIRILCVLMLFLFVRSKEDVLLYGTFIVLGTVGNNIFNFIRLTKLIDVKNIQIKRLNPFKHLKSVSKVFMLTVISTMYISLNSIFLGFTNSDSAVGYYTTGLKIFSIIFGIIGALTAVMLPRFSNLFAEKKDEEFKFLARQSYRFVISITLPLTVGLIIASPYAVVLLSGKSFEPAVLVSQIIAPLLLIIGLSNVFGMQILYPIGRIDIIIKAAIFASIVDILILILTVKHSLLGAALGYLCAEIVATVSMYILGKKHIPIKVFDKSLLNYVVAVVFMTAVLLIIRLLNVSNLIMILIMSITGALSYSIILILLKDSLYIEFIKKIKHGIFKKLDYNGH